MSVAPVTSAIHWNHAWWNKKARLSWPHPLLALGKLVLANARHNSKGGVLDPHRRAPPRTQERWHHPSLQERENWPDGRSMRECLLSWGETFQWPELTNSATTSAYNKTWCCPTLAFTPSRTQWSSWKNWSCGTITTGPPGLRSATGEWVEGKVTRIQSSSGSKWFTCPSCNYFTIRANPLSISTDLGWFKSLSPWKVWNKLLIFWGVSSIVGHSQLITLLIF